MTERAEQLADGLWRSTAPHPAWRPGDDLRPDGWERDVGCVLYAHGETVTIVGPLAGAGDDALKGSSTSAPAPRATWWSR